MIIGFTCGAFDLLHAGHVLMLEECKHHCDKLIVGLQTNPAIDRPLKNSPVQSIYERFTQLKACKYVDEIIPYDDEDDLLNLISTVPMNIRFVGKEYQHQVFTGKSFCYGVDIEIYYLNRYHNYSSSELRRKVYEQHSSI